MEEKRGHSTNEYRLCECLIGAVRMLLATELLFLALADILSSAFARWSLSETSFWGVQCILALAIVLFGVVAPACSKYRMAVYALLEVGLLVLGGWFTWKHFDRLKDGLFGLCDDYLTAWNAYYKTNFMVGNNWLQTGWTLGFLILVLMILCLLLRYVTGVRFLMLVPPLCALVVDLLVDCLPGWEGLACMFMGTLVLYSGAPEFSKLMFVPMRRREKGGQRVGMQLGALALAALLAFGVVSAAGGLFTPVAARIPEKTPEFMAFQTKLENDLMRLGNGIHFSSGKERLDNSTPEFRDEEILTITASRYPMSNLYLPEFYSGTYRNGQWIKDKREFSRAAAQSGYDADHMAMLIRQMGYENLSVILQMEEELQCRYTIEYGAKRTDSAWVPYLADLASLEGNAWVEDEGLVKKRWSTDALTVSGWSHEAAIMEFFPFIMSVEDEISEKDAIDWYSGYVREHYQDGSSLAAVQELVAEQRERGIIVTENSVPISVSLASNPVVFGNSDSSEEGGEDDFYFMENSSDTNYYRMLMASMVSALLAERCVYNLYLDDIPAGTDTIQYFLETGHEGYCMHFASAGALLLQELGVPARYASGYIVKRNAFSGNESKGYSAQVLDRNAHAWVEIYLENIGWVPVEMTPGYRNGADELPTDANKQEKLMEQHENKREEDSQEDSEPDEPEEETQKDSQEDSEPETEESQAQDSQKDSQQNAEGSGPKADTAGVGIAFLRMIARILGIALAVIALLAALVLFVRHCIRRYNGVLWEEMKRKQNRRAVQRINRRIYRRLQGGGIGALGSIRLPGRGSGVRGMQWIGITDAEYETKLVRAYPSVTQQEWAEYMRIVKKAAFADEAIADAELRHCYRVYRIRKRRKEQ